MILVLEGPDGAGKSTLARQLQSRLPANVKHTGPDVGGDVGALAGHLLRAISERRAAGLEDTVFDRFHLSEQVYGPILRGGDRLGDVNREYIDTTLQAWDWTVVVRCLPSPETCLQAWGARPENELVKDYRQMVAVYKAYVGLRTLLPVVDYDYTRQDVDELLAEIVRLRGDQ